MTINSSLISHMVVHWTLTAHNFTRSLLNFIGREILTTRHYTFTVPNAFLASSTKYHACTHTTVCCRFEEPHLVDVCY
jgi:hypothetical protein